MTIKEYLKHVNSDIKAKTTYGPRYLKIRNDIESTWYTVGDTSNVVVLIHIPSEKAKHVHYSVILEFPLGSVGDTAKKLLNSEMKVFSNCPSFVFMNAKYFEEKGFLIEWAKSLYDDKVFEDTEEKDAQREANAQATVRDVKAEKSLYYAAMHINQMSPIGILTRLNKAKKIKDTKTVMRHIKDAEEILEKRVRNAKKHPLFKKKESTKNETRRSSGTVKATSRVKTTGTVSKIKGGKNVRKIKHI